MAPVWMPPVTVKFAANAASPAKLFGSVVTGASPFRTTRLVADCAATSSGVSMHPAIKTYVTLLKTARILICLDSH